MKINELLLPKTIGGKKMSVSKNNKNCVLYAFLQIQN